MSALQKLQEWYSSQCNGLWEHGHGIKINTLDNPGWILTINLVETDLVACEFTPVDTERNTNDWIQCWKSPDGFQAAGGPLNLEEIIEVFLCWKDQNCRTIRG